MADTNQPTNGVNGTPDTIPLGLYLWTRIKQIGVNRIFGVPGDFNLTLLDHIYSVDGLEWVGNTNELNAAYAADGQAMSFTEDDRKATGASSPRRSPQGVLR